MGNLMTTNILSEFMTSTKIFAAGQESSKPVNFNLIKLSSFLVKELWWHPLAKLD